jgi:peptidyl-prolyl cis-trans isomerase B (cyclophilin B)
MFKKIVLISAAVVMTMTVTACKSRTTQPSDSDALAKQKKESVMTTNETKTWTEPTKADVDSSKKYTAVIKTSKGEIICELNAEKAPLSVTNFKYLADNGYYNGLTFHRVVPNFVIQGGDPTGTGSGGPGYTTPAEIGLKHGKGAMAWARTGDEVNPERRSSGSQFYITLEPTPFLDGAYTVFGQTIGGLDVVESISQGDTIETVEVRVE